MNTESDTTIHKCKLAPQELSINNPPIFRSAETAAKQKSCLMWQNSWDNLLKLLQPVLPKGYTMLWNTWKRFNHEGLLGLNVPLPCTVSNECHAY